MVGGERALTPDLSPTGRGEIGGESANRLLWRHRRAKGNTATIMNVRNEAEAAMVARWKISW